MKIFSIAKANAKFIEINEKPTLEELQNILNTKETISSCVRYIGPLKFRVYSLDQVDEPDFFSAMNCDGTADIPGRAIIILTDETFGQNSSEEFITINSLAESQLLNNTFIYKASEDNIEQPIIKWTNKL